MVLLHNCNYILINFELISIAVRGGLYRDTVGL